MTARRRRLAIVAGAGVLIVAVVLGAAAAIFHGRSASRAAPQLAGATDAGQAMQPAPPSSDPPSPEPAASAPEAPPSSSEEPEPTPSAPQAPPSTSAAPPEDTAAAEQPPGPVGSPLPLSYDGGATQVVTVVVPAAGATRATVTGWNREADGSWSVAAGPYAAFIGGGGLGQASEGSTRTPAGTYGLTQAFGRQPDPGTAMPYFQTGPDDWWDENPDSPTYNQHVVQADSPGAASENLYTSGSAYDYVLNIDYNLAGVPGAGSAFFIHVTINAPTTGCVGIPASGMLSLLRWLDPGASPVVVLGIG